MFIYYDSDFRTYAKHTVTQSVPFCFSWGLVYRHKLFAALGPHLLFAIKDDLEEKEITKPIKFSDVRWDKLSHTF